VLIRLIIIGIFVFFIFRMIRALLPSDRRSSSSAFRESGEKMVSDMAQDPQCGVYVDTKQAILSRAGNETIYFCSEECRNKYLKESRG
jgi:uncharacterized protein